MRLLAEYCKQISINEYLSTKVKVKPNVDFDNLIDTLNNIAGKNNTLIEIVDTVKEYYYYADEDGVQPPKKILEYLTDLVNRGYEPVLQTDYKTYFRLNKQPMQFNEKSKIITFSFYKPNSFQNAKNLSIDIYDFENLTWQLIIMSISENKCLLHEQNGDSFKQLKSFIEEGSLEFEIIINDILFIGTAEKICKYLTEKLS